MNSNGYNRTQVLCGLREAWASIIGTDARCLRIGR
jgi:hypothetical protein